MEVSEPGRKTRQAVGVKVQTRMQLAPGRVGVPIRSLVDVAGLHQSGASRDAVMMCAIQEAERSGESLPAGAPVFPLPDHEPPPVGSPGTGRRARQAEAVSAAVVARLEQEDAGPQAMSPPR